MLAGLLEEAIEELSARDQIVTLMREYDEILDRLEVVTDLYERHELQTKRAIFLG